MHISKSARYRKSKWKRLSLVPLYGTIRHWKSARHVSVTHSAVLRAVSVSLKVTKGDALRDSDLQTICNCSTVVELLLWTGVNSDGHLKTDLVTCKVVFFVVTIFFCFFKCEARRFSIRNRTMRQWRDFCVKMTARIYSNILTNHHFQVAANNVRLQFAASDAETISPYLPHISHFITERIEQVRSLGPFSQLRISSSLLVVSQ